MKYIYILFVLLLFASFAEVSAQEQTGIIKGEVYDEITKEPIIGANVFLLSTTIGATTDLDGKFTLRAVPVGRYSVRISSLGYTPMIISDVVVMPAKPVELRVGLMETLIESNEVEVTAFYFQKLPDKPLSTLVQSNEEIRRLPGGQEDVVRAISILPGVAQVQAGRNDLIVRGGAPSENLFIIDNIEVANINHFGTQGSSGGPLSYINLDFVERTTFSSGGFGVRYGDKLSSILTIDLKKGRTDRLGGKATISASQFGLNLEGPVNEQSSFLFSARRSYLDFIFKAAGFGFVPEYWDFLGKVHYRISPTDYIEVLGVAALDNVKYFNETADQRYNNSRILGSDQNQVVGGITWRHLVEKGYFTVTASTNYIDYDYRQNDSLLNPLFRNYSYEHESALRTDAVLLFSKKTELAFGGSIKNVRFFSNVLLPTQVTSFDDTIGLSGRWSYRATKAALYSQLTHTIGSIRISGGLRLDYFDAIEKKYELSARSSISYIVDPLTTVNVSAGRYYQAPSYIWLVANPLNKQLRFIAVNQYVTGVEHFLWDDTRVSFEVYLKEYLRYPASLVRPYLVLANTGAGFGGSMEGFASFGLEPLVSKGKGKAYGAEASIQKKLSEIPVYGTVSISYSKTEFVALDGKSRPNSFDQRWIINLGGGYVINTIWEVSAKFRYVSGRPYTPYLPDGRQIASLYNSLRTEANHSLDVRVDRRWAFNNWDLIVYIDIQNIYNKKPIDIPRYDQRTGKLISMSSIGILPSIGVSAEF